MQFLTKDEWTRIDWSAVTEVYVQEIEGIHECTVHIRGNGFHRILCMTPDKAHAQFIHQLVWGFWKMSQLVPKGKL